MKKFFCIIILFIALFFTACDSSFGPGTTDFQIKINDKYLLFGSSPDIVVLQRKKDNSNQQVIVIPKKITNFLYYNEKYILAKQVEFKGNKITSESVLSTQYWIVNLENDEVYGPLMEVDFNNKKDEFKIPRDMKLRKIEEYNKSI